MAGMVPGVECARRRRIRQTRDTSSTPQSFTRRSSFCLYPSNHESYHTSISSLKQRTISNRAYVDEKLGGVAREAKQRLDEKLGIQGKNSEPKRYSGRGALGVVDGRFVEAGELQIEVFAEKKIGLKRFNWAKLSSKACEQEDECTICLERFRSGDTMAHLPCAHRFHSMCLIPWLENNARCPCCRMEIHVELS